jgi:TetR/AcrR family transcriptional repressor of nem operon
MAGRNREFDEEKALADAAEVFWIKGYASASTEDLLAAMNINKGSMYNAFGNKRDLFIKVFEWFAARFIQSVKDAFKQSGTAYDALRSIFYNVAHPSDPQAHLKGCFYVNILGEMSGLDEELKKIAVTKLTDVEEVFCKELTKAKKNGELNSELSVAWQAKYLVNLWNGLNISRRIYTEKELEKLVDLNLKIVVP